MTKTKKKISNKLRKQIMRTASALTMIMAITVAAIPVENLQTTQAASAVSSVDIAKLYEAYPNTEYAKKNSSKDSVAAAYNADKYTTKITTQTISSDGEEMFNQYEISMQKATSNEGIITKYIGSETVIDVGDTAYYGYFYLDSDEYSDFLDKVKDDSFDLTFGTKSADSQTITITDADGTNPITINIPNIFDKETVSFSVSIGADNSSSLSVGGEYKYSGNNTAYYSYEDIFLSSYTEGKYNSYWKERENYNSEVNDLITQAQTAQRNNDKTAVGSATDDTNADTLVGKSKKLAEELSTLQKAALNVKISELSDDYSFVEKTICGRLKYNNGDTGATKMEFSLNGFNLKRIYNNNISKEDSDGKISYEGGTVYVPVWSAGKQDLDKTDNNNIRSSCVDENGYIVKGSVRIIGIGNEAFKDVATASITKVNLSNNIQFIGDSAFENCSSLYSVTLDPEVCKSIGNKAFYNCSLQSISFVGENGSMLETIGSEAFFQCLSLPSVTFPNSIKTIGMGAFANSGIKSIKFNENNIYAIDIRPFAFYNCTKLGSIDKPEEVFPTKNSITLGFGAFALATDGSGKMTTFNFPDTMTSIKAGDEIEFTDVYDFGGSGVFTCDANDWILANRGALQIVNFPKNMRGEIPLGTIWGCKELEKIVLGAISCDGNEGTNITYEKSREVTQNGVTAVLTVFKDIENPNFCVEGPGYKANSSTRSNPRTETVKLTTGDGTDLDNVRYIPYKFHDKYENEVMEISAGGGTDENGESLGDIFLATIDNLNSDGTARLVGYSYKDDVTADDKKKIVPITVQSNIGGYRITNLGAGCFNDIITNISKLIIEDNSIETIEENALKGASNLEAVYLPNSLESIGANAFADCKKLTDVYFSGTNESMSIADGAFNTDSDYLTFHGSISKTYAPFRYAMGLDNKYNAAFGEVSGRNICYSSDYPTYLKVIRDNVSGDSTLIDYPHMIEANNILKSQDSAKKDNDSSILRTIVKWINGYDETKTTEINTAINDYNYTTRISDNITNGSQLATQENNILDNVLGINILPGIQSFDTVGYFSKSGNSANAVYLTYTPDSGNDVNTVSNAGYKREDLTQNYDSAQNNSVKDLYSTTKSTTRTEGHPGLFSGLFMESGVGGIISAVATTSLTDDIDFDNYTENNVWGNDHLTSVILGEDIKYIPDYAFESCENLNYVQLGYNVDEMGELPFKGCTSLINVDCSDNPYFMCENGIIYGKSGESDEFDTIIEVLETRGDPESNTSNVINDNNDPQIKSVKYINYGAFSDCLYLQVVDLTSSKVEEIPEDCFKGDTRLITIKLPATTGSILDGAFTDMIEPDVDNRSVNIYILDPLCSISVNAVGPKNEKWYVLNAYEYKDDTNTSYSSSYNYARTKENVKFEVIKPGYTVTFLVGKDGTYLGEINEIDDPAKEVTIPASIIENLDAYDYPGHVFDYWQWTDSDGNVYTGKDAYNNVSENRTVYAVYAEEVYEATGEPVTVKVVNGTISKIEDSDVVNSTSDEIKTVSGHRINIKAASLTNKTFVYWKAGENGEYIDFIRGSGFLSSETAFEVPNPPETDDGEEAVITVYAMYVDTATVDIDNYDYNGADVKVNVVNGTLSPLTSLGSTGSVAADNKSCEMPSGGYISLTAETIEGKTFVYWTTGSATQDAFFVEQSQHSANNASFRIPNASSITITANYIDTPTSSTGSSDNTTNNGTTNGTTTDTTTGTGTGTTTSTTTKYTVTVNYGSGSGSYAAGDIVTISAYAPTSSSRVFSKWTSSNSSVGFADSTGATTTFVMPSSDVTVTANYKTRTDDDDDDTTTSSSRPNTSTTTTTVSTTPASTGTTTTTSTVGTTGSTGTTTSSNNNGNKIYITKNGVSNTDVASVSVTGSTDNFVVKITESDEANQLAKQALTSAYGSLEGISYFPMSITLYDSTGQNVITDTYGLNVTVTMPIPDVLIQYGGNARVASTDGGVLSQVTPKFTTIDGIACISFVPQHFSPYVIYVDTNNLIAGQMYDSTPTTGDPIHPKWFAAIGMACISVLLFVTSDGRKRRKFRTAS